jgi:hypothetical protein
MSLSQGFRLKEFTVILKTSLGLAFEIVKADYAQWDDEAGRLEFFNVAPGTEMLQLLSKVQSEDKPTNPKEGLRLLMKLLTAVQRMTVAGFARDSVAGYFQGRTGNLKIEVQT